MSITITVPNDDHVALRAMAKALEEIAVARGAPAQGISVSNHFSITQDETWKKSHGLDEVSLQRAQHHGDYDFNVSDEIIKDSQQVKSLSHGVPAVWDLGGSEPVNDPTSTPLAGVDSTGTPWDERIHSASKALNADGTWRVRRKPKDMDETEWSDYVESVKSELDRLCKDEGCAHHGTLHECVSVQLGNPDDPEAPLAEEWDGVSESIPEPSITPAGDDFHVDAGVVTEQQVADIPPPPPVPVNKVISTYQGADGGQHDIISLGGSQTPSLTFPQVMQFLTERHGRITSAQVDDIIADMGLNSIMDLNTQPEHTGPFIARVKSLLGE